MAAPLPLSVDQGATSRSDPRTQARTVTLVATTARPMPRKARLVGRRVHGKQQPRLATRGGGRTVTMCQTEIARRWKQTPPRARFRCTAQGYPSRPPSSREDTKSTHRYYIHSLRKTISSRSLRDDLATPHLRVSIRATARERVATYPARISSSIVPIVRDASQSVSSLLSPLSRSLSFSASRTHARDTATHSRNAVTALSPITQSVVLARKNSIEKCYCTRPAAICWSAVGESPLTPRK